MDGITVAEGAALTASRCRVRNARGNGMYVAARASFTECEILGAGQDGFHVETAEPVSIRDCVVNDAAGELVSGEHADVDNLGTDSARPAEPVPAGPPSGFASAGQTVSEAAGRCSTARWANWRRWSGWPG